MQTGEAGKTDYAPDGMPSGLVIWAAGMCAAIGFIMLMAWELDFVIQTTFGNRFTPVKADTALAILLAGLSVIASHTGRAHLKSWLGIAVVVISLSSVIEYAFGDLPLNDFLFKFLLRLPTDYMAPNTSLALLLIGLVQAAPDRLTRHAWMHGLRLALIAAAIGLGLAALTGYLARQEELYGWGNLTAMSPYTAFCVLLLGGILMVTGLQKSERISGTLPVVTAAIIATVTLLVWDGLKSTEKKNHHADIARLSLAMANAIDADLGNKATALERMAIRWEAAGSITRPLWEADALSYARDFDAKAINRADANGILRWVTPLAGNEAAVNFDLARDPIRAKALEKARQTRRTVYTPPLELVQGGGPAVVGIHALYSNNRLDGYITAPILLDNLLERIASPLLPANTRISLYLEGEKMAEAGHIEHDAVDIDESGKKPLQNIAGVYVQIEHDTNYLDAHTSHLPELVLVMGLLAAALVGMALRFWMTASLRARESEAASSLIKDREARINAIVDTAVEGIITIDERGIVDSMNPAASKIFGYETSEVIGRNVSMLMPEPYRGEHDGYLARYLDGGTPRIIGIGREVTGLRKNREAFPMDLAVSEMLIGGRRMFTGMVRDITERKRVEKLKSEFLSTVSHELRTPLTSITGSLGLIASGALGEFPEKARPMIDIAHKNSLRLVHLINDLLDLEKMAAGKMQFDLQQQALMPLVEQAVESMRGFAEQRQVGVKLRGRQDVNVRVDAGRLQQILTNFLSNAIKFSPNGKSVEIAVRNNGEQVRVEIIDHGPGIPKEFRSRIFEKFSQADASDTRKVGGTGLGLAISRELAQRMNGDVGFVSEGGHGATFYLELPVLKIRAESEDLAPVPHAPRLLVVEDDPDVAKLLELMLKRAEYQVDVALDGETALARLSQNHYDAMTLDLMLPDHDGMDLIRRIRNRAETEAIPIIVVSAQTRDGKYAISSDFANIDWLGKPVDEGKLLDLVRGSLYPSSGRRARVLHVEDDEDLFKTVSALGQDVGDFEAANTIALARKLLAQNRYDLIVLDIAMPDGNGWELLPQIKAIKPEPPVIVLSASELSAEQRAEVQAALVKTRNSGEELLSNLEEQLNSPAK